MFYKNFFTINRKLFRFTGTGDKKVYKYYIDVGFCSYPSLHPLFNIFVLVANPISVCFTAGLLHLSFCPFIFPFVPLVRPTFCRSPYSGSLLPIRSSCPSSACSHSCLSFQFFLSFLPLGIPTFNCPSIDLSHCRPTHISSI